MDLEDVKTPICEIGALSSSTQNPNWLSIATHFQSTVLSFLSFPDSPLFSNSSSFDRVLHEFLLSHSGDDDSVQDPLIDRTLQQVSLLLESTKRCFRKRLTLHNSISWFLPSDLTIKVFSMLDTKSLMQAAACCTMFTKYAMDPLCYSHIDLTRAFFEHADDGAVCTVIHRAGKELRSLKVGSPVQSCPSLITISCLAPLLSSDHEFTGNLLISLHVYHLESMDISSLCAALSACSNLTDLKLIGFDDPSALVLELLTRKCRLVEHLFLETSSEGVTIDTNIIEAFVTNCPNVTSLTLQMSDINDAIAQILVKGFSKLKYMNLSSRFGIDGSFLGDLGHSCKDSLLESLILRDCYSLEEREVLHFLNSLIAGNFRFIRYIDVSRFGDFSEPNFHLEKLKEERPDFKFVADYYSFRRRFHSDYECKNRIWETGALSTLKPNPLSVAPHFNQSHFEFAIISFLSLPDSPSLSSSSSSFDQVLHEFLVSHSSDDDDDSLQDQPIDRTLQRVSLLLESTKRCFRKRLTFHNSISWFLPSDLTIKVFSMLDSKSLMRAAACCTMFNKSAIDPLWYSHIDLTTAFDHTLMMEFCVQ